MSKTIEQLNKLGLTNVKESLIAGEYGDYYTCDQGEILINHDSGHIFLNDELLNPKNI